MSLRKFVYVCAERIFEKKSNLWLMKSPLKKQNYFDKRVTQ